MADGQAKGLEEGGVVVAQVFHFTGKMARSHTPLPETILFTPRPRVLHLAIRHHLRTLMLLRLLLLLVILFYSAFCLRLYNCLLEKRLEDEQCASKHWLVFLCRSRPHRLVGGV